MVKEAFFMKERTITVYDKNGKKIAVFANTETTVPGEQALNVMSSPTIDIVSNGESTLTFQMLIESPKWQQIKHPENLFYCKNRIYTYLNEQSIIYDGPVVTVTLVELWYLLKYKFVQAHNVDPKLEALDTHTVKILPKTDTKFKLTVNGKQYEDNEVKDSRGVVMPRGSAGYALWAILKGTDWTLGVCDVLPDGFNAAEDYGTFNIETDMKTALENIQFIQQCYGGILDWDSLHKVLSLRDERKDSTDFNTWKGFVARYGKNLTEMPKITWDNNLITRLYPLGNGNLNIAKVNNGKNYVDDFSFTNVIYEGYIQNENIYDTNDEGGQRTLKFWAEQKIKDLCRPRKSIEYDIKDRRATTDGWTEPFDINHVIKAYYIDTETKKEVWEYQRIQHLTENWFWPASDTVIEVGDKVSNEIELFHQIYKFTENSVKTDASGNISATDITIELPYDYLYEYYGDDWEMAYYNGGAYGNLNTITRLHAEHETANTKAVADLHVYADETFTTIASFTEFEAKTEDGFRKSNTRIDQVSTELYAQIDLEARHYEENKKYTSESIAALKLYVDGDFAQATLNASYNYTNQETGKVSNSLAEFKAYASQNYAQAQQVARLDGHVASVTSTVKSFQDGSGTISCNSLQADHININALRGGVIEGIGRISTSSLTSDYVYATHIIFGNSTLGTSTISYMGTSGYKTITVVTA